MFDPTIGLCLPDLRNEQQTKSSMTGEEEMREGGRKTGKADGREEHQSLGGVRRWNCNGSDEL